MCVHAALTFKELVASGSDGECSGRLLRTWPILTNLNVDGIL
jgi:hypothetical protein